MRYTILGYSQEIVTQLQGKMKDRGGKEKVVKLDTNDLLILRELADFMNRSKIVKYTIDDKTFFSIQYKVIIEDLPILNIKSQALSDRIEKIVAIGLLEKKVIRNQLGSFTAFRFTSKYEELQYSGKSSPLQVQGSPLLSQKYSTTSAQVVDYWPKDYITNTNNNSYSSNNSESEKSEKDLLGNSAIVDELKKNQSWRELMCMRFRITEERMEKYLDEFLLDLSCNATKHVHLDDAAKHFNNWLRIKIKHENGDNSEGQQRKDSYGARRGYLAKDVRPEDFNTSF